jgi:hypothetical protein
MILGKYKKISSICSHILLDRILWKMIHHVSRQLLIELIM